MITQLGYMGLAVSDLLSWERYATRVLGMGVRQIGGGISYLTMDDHHHRIVLHGGSPDDLAYLGWQVDTPAALATVSEKLRSVGVSVYHADAVELAVRKVSDLVWFEDLNGVRHEIYVGPLKVSNEPFKPGRPISRFVTGDLGLGHAVVWAVTDLEESTRFYVDVLGLRVSDYIDLSIDLPGLGNAVFFHCNARHHSFAVLESPGRRRAKTLDHFMVEVNSIDDVGSCFDILDEEGVALATTLGRHTNDEMLSFYMITPSGFRVEYGWGGRLIDDETWVVTQHRHKAIWGHKAVQPRIEHAWPSSETRPAPPIAD